LLRAAAAATALFAALRAQRRALLPKTTQIQTCSRVTVMSCFYEPCFGSEKGESGTVK
jgi:hypothetical protein